MRTKGLRNRAGWARCVALGAVIAAAAIAPAGASGSAPPRMFTTINSSGNGIFKVRPHSVVTDSADGGELDIHWSRWTATSATGSGTSHPDHGSDTIRVQASRVVEGYFTRLTVWFKQGSSWRRDRLGLGYLGGVSLAWINLAWMRNPQSGSTPWPA